MRIFFFAKLYGKNTETALPLINLLDPLTVYNIFKLQSLKFIQQWVTKQLPPIFDNYFIFAKNTHSYNTGYASNNNLCRQKIRTNTGKQFISAIAPDLWKEIPNELRLINKPFIFKRKLKELLLQSQNSLA